MPERLYGMINACRNRSSSHDACGQAPNHVTGSIGGSIAAYPCSLLRERVWEVIQWLYGWREGGRLYMLFVNATL